MFFEWDGIFLGDRETGLNAAKYDSGVLNRAFGAHLSPIFFNEHPGDLTKARIKNLINFVHNWLGNTTVKGLRNSASDAGQCICVAAKRNRCSDGVFKISRVNECTYSLWDCSLTRDIKFIGWANLIDVFIQIVLTCHPERFSPLLSASFFDFCVALDFCLFKRLRRYYRF